MSYVKAYVKSCDSDFKTWIYGKLEILIDRTDLTERYYVVTNTDSYLVDKGDICKLTPIKSSDVTNNEVFHNDIIQIDFQDAKPEMFVVRYGDGDIFLDDDKIKLYGLMLTDFNKNNYLFSEKIINHPECITVVGNILENNMNDFLLKGEN